MKPASPKLDERHATVAAGRSSKGGRPSLEVAAQLRNHLLEVALREYCAHGLDGVTLSDIAREAQVSKRTLYTRFKDREALLVGAIEHGIEQLLTPICDAVPDGTLRDQLLFVGGEMMQASLRKEAIGLERLIAVVQHRIPDVYQRVVDTVQNGRLSLIQSVLGRAAERGEIDGRALHIAASILFDVLVTQPRREAITKPAGGAPSEDYLHQALDMILYGICVRPQ